MTDRRRYSTALRAEQTALTRSRVLDAAGELFTARGYLGTTVAAVAKAAGVSVQTVYNVVGAKPVLLKAVYDSTLAGDDEPVPIAERPVIRRMMSAPTARECLAHYAALGRLFGERTLPLVTMALAQAATGDAELRRFADTIEAERGASSLRVTGYLAERFGLRAGLDVPTAADLLWVLVSPDIADRLVNRRGWGWDRYERWLAGALADALLGPDGRAPA